MKKTREIENILSLPTIQNYQNSFLVLRDKVSSKICSSKKWTEIF